MSPTQWLRAAVGLALVVAAAAIGLWRHEQRSDDRAADVTRTNSSLPPASQAGGMSLSEALSRRRSRREFSSQALSRDQIAQLCWAAQGISDTASARRTAPSAGALYPLTIYVVDATGVHEYAPATHSLFSWSGGDLRRDLQRAALDQSAIGQAPASFVVAFDETRTAAKYGGDAQRYCLMEAGHAAQNLLLQATALGLGAVPIGAVDEQAVRSLLALPRRLTPAYVIPVGHPAADNR